MENINDNTVNEMMNIVIVGHVDHGKSTVIGRLLVDTHSVPSEKIEKVKSYCHLNSKPFEYAFLLDALKDEQEQGITIDSARIFFKSSKRDYIIIDAPGHIEFLKNMISGASRAEAALLVIDANEGIKENSYRHAYILSMLGIHNITVLVNKMDLIDYEEAPYLLIQEEYKQFLEKIQIAASSFIPISGFNGDNIVTLSDKMGWYKGKTVLESLDLIEKGKKDIDRDFRMPVQGVYKFTRFGDDRRIIAGTILTGSINVGDEVVFSPSGKKSHINSIEFYNQDNITGAHAGQAIGLTLKEQVYIKRGELVSKKIEKEPKITSKIKVSLFWLDDNPMTQNKDYLFKIMTEKVSVRLEEITYTMNASNLAINEYEKEIEKFSVANCTFSLKSPIAFDLFSEYQSSGRFVIVDDYEIKGGGIILEALSDKQSWIRDKVSLRNTKWEKSLISPLERAERYNQKSYFLLVTGSKDVGKKSIARALESYLFHMGKLVYFISIGSFLYGLDADIKKQEDKNNKEEHIRRLAEFAHIMLDAGIILIVTAINIEEYDLNIIKTVIDPDKLETIWVGDKLDSNIDSNISYDRRVSLTNQSLDEIITTITEDLQEKGIIFKAW